MRALLLLLCACQAGRVDDHLMVVHDGAVLPVAVHGDLSSGTLVVWESGGPSGPGMAERMVGLVDFRDTLEQHVAVAMYDRRGVGNLDGNYDPDDITAEVLLDDLDAVGLALDARYAPERTVLMGHSFGGALTALYLAEGRGTYDAWVPVAPGWAGDDLQVQLDYRLPFACRVAAGQLADGATDPFYGDVRAFCAEHDAVVAGTPEADVLWDLLDGIEDRLEPWPGMDAVGLLGAVGFSGYALVDSQLRGNRISGPVRDSLVGVDLIAAAASVDLPTLVVTGEFDALGNTEMAEAVRADVVQLDGGGHYPFADQPEAFAEAVLEHIRR